MIFVIGDLASEAVELASRYSTAESGRFVNGVLAKVARELRPTEVAPEPPHATEIDAPEIDAPDSSE